MLLILFRGALIGDPQPIEDASRHRLCQLKVNVNEKSAKSANLLSKWIGS